MVDKKKLNIYLRKYGIALKVAMLFMLVFTLQTISCPICYAGVDDNFSQNELDQINDYFDTDFDLTHLNNAYSRLKSFYSNKGITINKLNVLFQYQYLNNSTYSYYVTLFANNGTFNNSLDYLCFFVSNSTDYVKTITSVDDVENRKIYGQYIFKYKNGNFDSNSGTGNLTSPINSAFSPYSINGNFFSSTNILTTANTQAFYFYDNNNIIKSYFSSNYINLDGYTPVEPEPDEPSGDNSGDVPINPSGDSGGGGTIDYTNQLNNINNSINTQGQAIISNQNQNTQTIVNTISGETQKVIGTLTEPADIDNTTISSGDFSNIVDFSPINNNQEYTAISNLWYELLIAFSNALTNVNRSVNIEFRGQIFTINLDDFTLNVPTALKIFLASFTTAYVVIYISKNIKHIIEDIQTASIDNVANKLTEDFETNLF